MAELARCAQLCFFCVMSATAILRTRIDPRRKARVEKILDQLGMTSTQAVNMFFAQIERRKAIPFPVTVEDNSDIAPPIEHVAKVWGDLDQTDFSHLDKR
ncbi:MAG TPA: type II toxin-antitoxin system RelB/DinJ family antitoxin [Opitutaceae bacterium]|nr:type II toxin-antitoxin system RelB/DinJ family antitoxin [Opitutaceae bacterium]